MRILGDTHAPADISHVCVCMYALPPPAAAAATRVLIWHGEFSLEVTDEAAAIRASVIARTVTNAAGVYEIIARQIREETGPRVSCLVKGFRGSSSRNELPDKTLRRIVITDYTRIEALPIGLLSELWTRTCVWQMVWMRKSTLCQVVHVLNFLSFVV